MGAQTDARSDVRDPNTGELMVPLTQQDPSYRAQRALENTGVVPGAERVAARILEKAGQFGRIYVNPRTGYQMRVADAEYGGSAGAGARSSSAGAGRPAGGAAAGTLEEELEAARARVRELEARRS